MEHETGNLADLAGAALRMSDVTQNGALFFATTVLLAARLGPESLALVEFARRDESYARQLNATLKSAETRLAAVGQGSWLDERRDFLVAMRRELEEIRDLREARRAAVKLAELVPARTAPGLTMTFPVPRFALLVLRITAPVKMFVPPE